MKFAPQRGYVMLYALLMITVLVAFSALYYSTTRVEIWTTKYGRSNTESFYAAEGALNLRAEEVRQKFIGYNQPSGTTPSTSNGATPCVNNNNGSGDYICKTHNFGSHLVTSYIIPDSSNPYTTTIPSGEKFSGLTAFEYAYTVHAESKNSTSGKLESIVELKFRSRNVPLYQFAYFLDKDYELSPAAAMTVTGRVHTNYDLYLNAGGTDYLSMTGQLTAAGDVWRGLKSGSASGSCTNNSVRVLNPTTYSRLGGTCGSSNSRFAVPTTALSVFNSNVVENFTRVSLPPISSMGAGPGKVFWDRADLRLALMLNTSENADTTQSTTGVVVISRTATTSSQKDATATTTLNNSALCPGSISGRAVGMSTWKNYWINTTSGANMRVLDIDVQALFNCLKTQNWFGWPKTLADTTDGGIVIHATVIGPNSTSQNRYGVRVRNATELKSTSSGAPTIKGLTVVTDQPIWVMGNFNITNKKPAAILGDTVLIHSNQWADTNTTYSTRNVSATTSINAAMVTGSGITGGVNGVAGQGGSMGLNTLNFEENWNGKTFNLTGSVVSISNPPSHFPGAYQYGSPWYSAPTRNITYDTSFNDPANLPPLSLQFIYLREELFIRDFEQ
ncbi:hypothetical protein JNK13_02575 [bacterium]|nr:hypothetical protein [bacterium]